MGKGEGGGREGAGRGGGRECINSLVFFKAELVGYLQ